MEMLRLLDRSEEIYLGQVRAVGEGDWALPTPCTEWTVGEVVDHVTGTGGWWADQLGWPVPEAAGQGRVVAASVTLSAVRDAVRRACAAGTTVPTRFGGATAEDCGMGLVGEHLVHAWDVAVACGTGLVMDPALAAEVAAWFTSGWGERGRGVGAIAPRPPVTPSGPQEELLVAYGRDPHWFTRSGTRSSPPHPTSG